MVTILNEAGRHLREEMGDGEGEEMLRDYLRINKKQLQLFAKVGTGRLIYADGMPHSGSTLLFNIIRIVLSSDPLCRLSSGWVGDALALPRGNTYLLKTHGIKPLDAWRAYRLFHSFRDPRDALVSGTRKHGRPHSIERVRLWMRWYAAAEPRADLMVRYEDMVADTAATVRKVAEVLRAEDVDVTSILESLPTGAPDELGETQPHSVTLMHRNHRTGTVAGDWRTVLAPELQEQIAAEFGPWLERNGYSIS